jgi:hypothetical protein
LSDQESHEPTMVVNNVIGLAKAAKVFGVSTILTTVTRTTFLMCRAHYPGSALG